MSFILEHTQDITQTELENNEILVDSVMFRLIQISEHSDKLTDNFKSFHCEIPWRAIKGLRNRIVHEYGNVDLSVVYHTIIKDIPALFRELQKIKG